MKKLFLIIAAILITAGTGHSETLVLSDIIQQAREAMYQQEAQQKINQSIQPVKNTDANTTSEKAAAEKINPQEIINQAQNN